MKVITTMEELMEMIENANGYCGLRGASEHDIEIADRGYLDCSIDNWDGSYDYENEELLPGTSAICVTEDMEENELSEHYNRAKEYAAITQVVYLISDSVSEYGFDEDEIVLGHNGYGADVLAEVRL